MKTTQTPPQRIALKINVNPAMGREVLKDEDARKSYAASLALICGVCDNRDDMPYMPSGDSFRWSIDRYGNDFWVLFSETDNLKFTLSCRYPGEQAKLLEALANYVALRLGCTVLGED